MSGRHKWSEVKKARSSDQDSADRREAARAALDEKLNDHVRTLSQLRRARRLTQKQLAMAMRVSQAQVSRVENQADLYLSTLRSYVEAMGGELEIRVAFPGGAMSEVAIGDLVSPAEDVTNQPTSDEETAADVITWLTSFIRMASAAQVTGSGRQRTSSVHVMPQEQVSRLLDPVVPGVDPVAFATAGTTSWIPTERELTAPGGSAIMLLASGPHKEK
jgi:transcriptional regulator with XRE-family HTH domain